jgi:hypothetical protein
LIGDPTYCPVGFALDARDGLNGVKKVFAFGGLLDLCVDEEGVGFGVDVLHHNLETIEAPCLGSLDFIGETLLIDTKSDMMTNLHFYWACSLGRGYEWSQ